MKVAFVGKGGSGKTTLASLFARWLSGQGAPVLAIDADINQHLATALGATPEQAASWPTLGDNLPSIKEYLCGNNPLVSPATMIKTTPPGHGSRLVGVTGNNPIYDTCVRNVGGLRLAVTGGFTQEDLGVSCYHSKTGAVELLLNHMVDLPREYVVVDMTAGADAFASGLFTRFDMTFLVCEPTLRSVGVYRQYADHSVDFGVRLAVIGNKVENDTDVAFLHEHVGNELLTCLGRSEFVKAGERGRVLPIAELESPHATALHIMRKVVDACQKDWRRYQEQAAEFHLLNAKAWGNARMGQDLAAQIDPHFVMSV